MNIYLIQRDNANCMNYEAFVVVGRNPVSALQLTIDFTCNETYVEIDEEFGYFHPDWINTPTNTELIGTTNKYTEETIILNHYGRC